MAVTGRHDKIGYRESTKGYNPAEKWLVVQQLLLVYLHAAYSMPHWQLQPVCAATRAGTHCKGEQLLSSVNQGRASYSVWLCATAVGVALPATFVYVCAHASIYTDYESSSKCDLARAHSVSTVHARSKLNLLTHE